MTKARATGTTGGAKGALVVGTGSTTAAPLTVGTDGQVLTAASGQTTGLQWATPAAGSLTLLSTTSLAGSSSTTISSISQSYKSLQIFISNVVNNTLESGLLLRFNGDATGPYNYGHQKAASSTGGASTGGSYIDWGHFSYSSGSGTGVINIPQYSLTSGTLQFTYSYGNTSLANYFTGYGTYPRTVGISSITFADDSGYTFTSGTVQIYGVN